MFKTFFSDYKKLGIPFPYYVVEAIKARFILLKALSKMFSIGVIEE